MSPRYLIDTNILVYPYDRSEPAKRAGAATVLRRLKVTQTAMLPAQALAEFASVTMKKLKPALTPQQVQQELQDFEQAFPVIPLTAAIVLEAVRGVRDHQLAYFDAQLWAAAKLNQIPVILSEDFNSGSRLEGVSFLNPFDPRFDAKAL